MSCSSRRPSLPAARSTLRLARDLGLGLRRSATNVFRPRISPIARQARRVDRRDARVVARLLEQQRHGPRRAIQPAAQMRASSRLGGDVRDVVLVAHERARRLRGTFSTRARAPSAPTPKRSDLKSACSVVVGDLVEAAASARRTSCACVSAPAGTGTPPSWPDGMMLQRGRRVVRGRPAGGGEREATRRGPRRRGAAAYGACGTRGWRYGELDRGVDLRHGCSRRT